MGRAKCTPQGEGLCKDTRLGLAQGYVSSCTVTHGNGRGPRRLQGRGFYLRFYFASERGVRTGPLCVAAAGFRRYWPFTSPPSRGYSSPFVPASRALLEPSMAWTTRTSLAPLKRRRAAQKGHVGFSSRDAAAASLPACCVNRDVYANTTANLAHKYARALDHAGDLFCKRGGCFCGGHNAVVPRFFSGIPNWLPWQMSARLCG